MSAHPRCPCTRASLNELDNLLVEAGDRVRAHILFVRPAGVAPEDWQNTEHWRRAQSIARADVVLDDGGVESKRFDVHVSGTVVLYDPQGKLLFRGGITPSRGHEGDSFGRRRIVDILSGRTADRQDSPAFGCPIAGG
jgi:hypothetical protein